MSVVSLSPGEHHNITFTQFKIARYRVPPTRYAYEDMVAYAL
jgi:hypothetical protein